MFLIGLSAQERGERFSRRFRGVQLEDFLGEYNKEPEEKNKEDMLISGLVEYSTSLEKGILEAKDWIGEYRKLEKKLAETINKNAKER